MGRQTITEITATMEDSAAGYSTGRNAYHDAAGILEGCYDALLVTEEESPSECRAALDRLKALTHAVRQVRIAREVLRDLLSRDHLRSTLAKL